MPDDERFTCSGCGDPSSLQGSVVIQEGYIQTTVTQPLDGRYCRACAPLGRDEEDR